jgi:hypothetical protein
MNRTADAQAVVKELLSTVSNLEMRVLCVQALRRAYAGDRADYRIVVASDLLGHLKGLLGERKGWTTVRDPKGVVEVFRRDPSGVQYPLNVMVSLADLEVSGVVEFLVWFVRAGFAWPLGSSSERMPDTLRLTAAGHRFLRASEDHPFLPGFIDRLLTRCPGLPDDVVSLMVDARACLDQGLMRPAIVLLGVSYEVAVEHVVVSLSSPPRALLPTTLVDASAAKCIAEIDKLVDSQFPGPTMKDDRAAVHTAYEFANQLRRRRNDAAHTQPTYGFEDREEVEELIVSAGRHLPNLWRLH